MTKKIFKRNLSDRLKKSLLIGVAMLALGGAQQAKAQGFLEGITRTLENVNHKVNQVNIKISNYNIQKDRLKKNIDRLNYNTGRALSPVSDIVSLVAAQKIVKTQVKRSGGTYVASPQEFSDSPSNANEVYFHSVQNKVQKRAQSSAQTRSTVQSQSKGQRNVLNPDVQKVLNALNEARNSR